MKRRAFVPTLAGLLLLTLLMATGCQFASLPQTLGLSDGRGVAQAQAVEPTAIPDEPDSVLSSDTLAAVETALTGIYEEVSPSVVYIQVWARARSPFAPMSGNGPDAGQAPLQQGSGSGFVWDRKGHMVTNNHVVEDAEKIRVTFSDGTVADANLVGANADSDLAVIKVDVPAEQLLPVRLADSDQVAVGQLAVAIGNPFGLESTMTVGIVSALGRSLPVEPESGLGGPTYSIPEVIQTDAPINPGNSGGVLVNDRGEVIGVTTAIVSPVQASAGIGFAVPAAIVEKVVPALIETGSYTYPWLGISGTSLAPGLAEAMGLDAHQRGALIQQVVPGGPAEDAGLRGSSRAVEIEGMEARVGGDVIVALDGRPVKEFEDLVAYLVRSTQVGQEVELTVLRDGRELDVIVTLGARPGDDIAAQPQEAGDPAGQAWLGIRGTTITSEIAGAMELDGDQLGVLVTEVVADSPADLAGLRGSYKPVEIEGERMLLGGDVIVAWGTEPVEDLNGLQELVGASRPGDSVTVTVLRDGATVEIEVTLAARPDSDQ
jgi:S1-C subfamily serine protease